MGLALVGAFGTGYLVAHEHYVLRSYAALAVLSLLAALALHWGARCRTATAAAILWFAATVWFCGWLPVGAIVVMAAAALSVGTLIRARRRTDLATTLALGIVLIAGIAGWTLEWAIHVRWAWLLGLLLLSAWRHRPLAGALDAFRRGWSRSVARSPMAALFAVTVCGLAVTSCWLPDLQSDDLAYHLRLPAQLAQEHVYAPRPALQVWAYSPWLGDTWQGIAAVLAGREAHGAVNALWLLLVAMAAWHCAGRLGAHVRMRWLAAALACGTPLLSGVAGGMQTELPATALALCLFAEVFALGSGSRARWLTIWILAAGLLALKLMHAYAALPLCLVAAWRHGPGRSWLERLGAAALVVFLGTSAYLAAWRATGNPVLPLFNAVFRSPLMPPTSFDDPRWHAPLGWTLPWELSFHTTRFLETGTGALGVLPLLVAGVAVSALAHARLRLPMVIAVAMAALPLALVSYARYALPGLICASVVGVAALARMPGLPGRHGRRAGEAVLATTIALGLAALPAGNWLLETSALHRLIKAGGEAEGVVATFLPYAMLAEHVPPDGRIVLDTDPSRGYVAPFGARGRTVSWYAPSLMQAAARADADPSGSAWRALFARTRAGWVLVDADVASAGLVAALSDGGARLRAQCGSAHLWEWSPAGADRRPPASCNPPGG